MRILPVSVLPLLIMGAEAQKTQVFTVDPFADSRIVVSGRPTWLYPPNIDDVLGPMRTPETNAWLPFGVTVSNNTSQGIIAYAGRWTVTDQSGHTTTAIMTRTLFGKSGFQIPPGKVVVLTPPTLIASQTPGIPGAIGSGQYDPTGLAAFQNAAAIRFSLDGIVLASGQFIGNDAGREFEQFSAESTAGFNLASSVQAKRDAGTPTSSIIDWLQQTAAVRLTGSLANRDWNAAVTAQKARRLVQVYRSGGEPRLYATVQQQLQTSHVTLYR